MGGEEEMRKQESTQIHTMNKIIFLKKSYKLTWLAHVGMKLHQIMVLSGGRKKYFQCGCDI